MVSVIIPVYNVAPYLRESLDSVINQTYEKLEIIIIDDGSTDGSREICEEYASRDERIRLIHQENKGLSAARNAGLNIMSGDVVAFLDSDDAYHPDFIRNMMETMYREKTDIVVCGYSRQKTEGLLKYEGIGKTGPSIHTGRYSQVEVLRALADGKLNHGVWNKLYKKELWENIRFPEGFVYEEVRTTYRILELVNTITVIDQPLYRYRDRQGSITNTRTCKNIRDRLIARDEFESFITHNVPKIFSKKQLEKWRYDHFVLLISSYVQLGQVKMTDHAFIAELRIQIIRNWRKQRIQDVRIRILRYLICYCPWLLKKAYPLYRRMKAMKWKIS